MKLNRKNPILLASLTLALTLAAPSTFATDLYWDTDGATAGAGGATPSGSWATGGTTWSTDSTGATATDARTTSALSNLFFSAGTDATGSYTVSLSGTQNAKSLTFEEGTATLTGGTLTLAGGGGITVLTGSGNPTISSNLTISGGNTFDVGSSRSLTLGGSTRNSGSTLNVQGSGTVTFTSGSLSNRIIGPWASFGTSTSTSYATADSITGVVSALAYAATPSDTQGTSVTTSASVNSKTGTVNYNLGATGTLGAGANVNTLRFTAVNGTTAQVLNSSGTFTTKGVMYVGGGVMDLRGTITSGSSATEMVINSIAAGNVRITGTSSLTGSITKTGSGTFTIGSNTTVTGIGAITVNEGLFITTAVTHDTLVGATINSGGTLQWFATNKHQDTAVFTINAGGILNIGSQSDTIGGIAGAGTVTGTSGTLILSEGGNTFSGVIEGGMKLTKTGSGTQILSGTNTYTGETVISGGTLLINGNSSSTSLVTVGVNGTLGGTGTVGGNTTISGTHNPGNSPGIQTFTNNLSYVDGGTPDPTVNWELASNTTTVGANPTASFDQIIVGGDLDFTDITTINLSFNGTGSTVLWADALWTADQSWLLYDVAGTTSNFSNLSLNTVNWLDSVGNLFSTTGGSFSLGQSGQDVVLNFTAVPEPRAALLGGLGLLALLRRRRN